MEYLIHVLFGLQGVGDHDGLSRMRTSGLSSEDDDGAKMLPTVFKWEGGGKSVYISGSFDNWQTKLPMVKR